MIDVQWSKCGENYCLTEQGLKDTIKNVNRLIRHIQILEGQIDRMNGAFCGR